MYVIIDFRKRGFGMDYFAEIKKLKQELEKLHNKDVLNNYVGGKSDNQINALEDKIKNLEELIVNASNLNFELMGSVMSNIVTMFEEERYEFYSTYISVLKDDEMQYETMYFIAPCILNKSGLTWDFLTSYPDILVFYNERYEKSVNFLRNKELQRLDYGKFDYLSDFIKYVINYKLNNNVKIYVDNIEIIMDEFIELNINEINNRKIERERQRRLFLS